MMKIYAERATIQLAAQNSISFCGDLGTRIRPESGLLWVTQDGDPRDIVVAPGGSFRIDRAGTIVVFALQPSAFALEEQPLDAAPTAAPARFWERMFGAPEESLAC